MTSTANPLRRPLDPRREPGAPRPSEPGPGSGISSTFLCGCCNQGRLMGGRKRQRVRGLLTYICAECAARRAAAVPEAGVGK